MCNILGNLTRDYLHCTLMSLPSRGHIVRGGDPGSEPGDPAAKTKLVTLCSAISLPNVGFFECPSFMNQHQSKAWGSYLDELLCRGGDFQFFPCHPKAAFQARVLDLLLQQGHQVPQREQHSKNQEGGVFTLNRDQQACKGAMRSLNITCWGIQGLICLKEETQRGTVL